MDFRLHASTSLEVKIYMTIKKLLCVLGVSAVVVGVLGGNATVMFR